jgi:1,4-dihydroxy-6-naphthoate synthase
MGRRASERRAGPAAPVARVYHAPSMKLTLGISPCPNDTFIFDALVNGALDTGGLSFEVVHEDVETLNEWALAGRLDATKISYGVLPAVADRYALLASGGALGHGVGPLLVARPGLGAFRPDAARVALPGRHTTAHLLFSLAFPGATHKEFMVFSAIEAAVLSGAVDAGVIIHEGRFTYEAKGLVKVLDLGEHWERETRAPVPLGAIVARRTLGPHVRRALDGLVRASAERALAARPLISAYVRRHAREMDEAVMRRHVDLYVNEHSVELGESGRRAVEKLLEVHARLHPDAAVLPAAVFG